jgi:CheY-like chemotaxis protein
MATVYTEGNSTTAYADDNKGDPDTPETDRRQTEFLATLAHELRNPLAPLRNSLEIIRVARNDPAVFDEACKVMERQMGHMVRLIDDLLDVSRMTRGRIILRKERIDVGSVVQDAVEASRPLIEASSQELTVTVPRPPVYVDADRTRLAQVVTNLLNNSAKYTGPRGKIWLTVEPSGNEILIRVKDTGIGFPKELKSQLFDMFTHAGEPPDRLQEGLGIGLTLVRGLVQKHGGSVEASSAGPGHGSEFTVRLPAISPGPYEKANGKRSDQSGGGRSGQRILVVDDNKDSAASLAMMLRMMGHQTNTTFDGIEAIEKASSFRPNVVLLDIGLPKLGGYEACRRIRAEPWGQSIVLIALTGWGQEEDKRRAKEAGFNFHLVKPVDPAVIQKMLAGLVRVPA